MTATVFLMGLRYDRGTIVLAERLLDVPGRQGLAGQVETRKAHGRRE